MKMQDAVKQLRAEAAEAGVLSHHLRTMADELEKAQARHLHRVWELIKLNRFLYGLFFLAGMAVAGVIL